MVPAAFSSPGVPRLAAAIDDWARLVDLAAFCQVRPALARLLEDAQLASSAARAARDRLGRDVLAISGRGKLLAGELLRLLGALERAGVPSVPFKGPAFGVAMGQAHAREMNDLDILVAEEYLTRAADALAAVGYAPMFAPQAVASAWLARVTNELPFGSGAAPYQVELHWRLAPAWYAAPITVHEVFSCSSARGFFGESVSWPEDEALFLLHVSDGMKSGGWGVRWLGDVAAVLRASPTLDWARIEEIASGNGALNNVCITLAMVEGVCAAAADWIGDARVELGLPPAAQALAARARASRRMAGAIEAAIERLAVDDPLEGPIDNFRWAVSVADSRAHAAAAIARHLAGPSVADLEAMPSAGLADGALRARAWARRLGAAR